MAFAAFTIFGLGMTSLATGEDVIEAPGLGQVPGIVGVVLAVVVFAGGLWAAIAHADDTRDAAAPAGAVDAGPAGPAAVGAGARAGREAGHPSFWGSAWTTAACFLAYIGGVWLGAVLSGVDVGVATAVAGRLATSWFGVAVALAAFVCSWAGIALVRTRARRPRWPWEDEFDE
jgi:hypothetical protein